MLTPCICGAFSHTEGDDHDISSPSCLTPRKSRKHSTRRKNNENPYSSSGLEKFSKLLSELEAKRRQVLSQNDSQGTSLVRFVFKGSDPDKDCEPVVVKVRQDQQNYLPLRKQRFGPSTKREARECKKHIKKQGTYAWWVGVVAAVLILASLAALGRSGATLIMVVVWYLIPVIWGKSREKDKYYVSREVSKKRMGSSGVGAKKLDYVRKVSDNFKTPKLQVKGHAHRKSW
uniref:Uncharacterized protein n=1 Tax=Kalanchoe fedtschenkoi TaxID=63787 RepID=A0A7N0RFV4_KALFE